MRAVDAEYGEREPECGEADNRAKGAREQSEGGECGGDESEGAADKQTRGGRAPGPVKGPPGLHLRAERRLGSRAAAGAGEGGGGWRVGEGA